TVEDLVFEDAGPAFSQVCRDELMTLRYDRHSHKPMRLRFHEQRGVTVSIPDYGKPASAPFYEPMRLRFHEPRGAPVLPPVCGKAGRCAVLRADVCGAGGRRLHARQGHP